MNKSFIGKKLLSLLLSVLMCLSLIPSVAFATIAEGETATVAKIGNTEYTDLPSAIKAAGADDTVVLTDNITLSSYQSISKKVTLDLNGKTLSSTAIYTISLSANGDLTVKDSSNGEGKICNEYSKTSAPTTVYLKNNNTKFTLESGTIESHSNIAGSYAIRIAGSVSGTININGGKVIVPLTSGYGIAAGANAVVNINNGEITGGGYAVNMTGGSAVINGGVLTSNNEYALHISNSAVVTVGSLDAETTPVINGIKFESADLINIPNITLVKGKITKVLCMNEEYTYDSFIFTIPDGALLKFGDDSVKPFIPANVTLTNNEDGTYSIGTSKTYVAKIGDTEYESLQEAFDAANTGDTVTLLTDITLTEQVNITKSLNGLTLDGNGKTITCATTTDPSKSGGTALYFGNPDKNLWCTGIKIKDLTMTGIARYAIFLSGGTTTEFTNVNISGKYYIAVNLYGTHGATMTDCNISNSNLGIDKYSSAIWTNVASQNPLILNNSKVNVIAINKYTTANKLAPKIFVNNGSEVGEIHNFDDGSVSGNKKLCVSTESTGSYTIKEYVLESNEWINIRVAKIGDTYYESLQDAINAAKSGNTVTLVSNTRENVSIAKKLTLDLNGYTLNGGTESGKAALYINNKSVTVKDSSESQTGTIMREDTDGAQGYYVIDIQGNYGVLTFEGGNVKNDCGVVGGRGSSLVNVGNDSVNAWSTLTINGGKFTQDNFVAIKVDRGVLYLKGGEVNSANSYAIENWNKAFVQGGTVNGKVSSWVYSTGADFSELTISGGKINGIVASVNYDDVAGKQARIYITGGEITDTLGIYTYDKVNKDLSPITDNTKATIEVTGGIFDFDPTAYVVEDSLITEKNGKYNVAKTYLAKVGDKQYYTMQEAFDAQTASGEDIELLRDYETNQIFYSGSRNRAVNLNGYTWTYTITDIDSAAFEINHSSVTLTVKNGKVISNSMIGLIPSAMSGTIKYDNSTLIFEDVEMTANGHSGFETNGNNTDDTITLRSSTLNVPNGYGIYFPSSGTLNIENSTINAKTMGVQVCSGSLNISSGSTINVTGDPVEKTENDGAIEDGAAISIVNRPGYKGLVKVTITGGKFKSENGKAIKAYKWKDMAESDFGLNVIAVSGGTFSSAVPEDYCEEGFISSKNDDGTYTVKEGAYVAEVGGVKYESLEAAYAAAADNATITLLANCSSDRINLEDKSITLVLNGYTVTAIAANGVLFCAKNGNTITIDGTVADSKVVGTIMITSGTYGHIVINGGTYESALYCPIYVNGAVSNDESTVKITNAVITALNGDSQQDNGVAVYLAGYTTSTFTDCTITAPVTGIEIRAGKLDLINCNVTGGSGEIKVEANSNGTTVANAAVAVSQHNTKKAIELNITGGTYTGAAAVYQTDVQGTGSEGVKVKITDGRFNGLINADTANAVAISGGTFNRAVPANCCADGFIPKNNGDGTYGVKLKPAVTETKKLTVTIGNGEVSYKTDSGLDDTWSESFKNGLYESGAFFTVMAIPDEGYKFLYWINKEGRILSDNPTYSFYLNDNVTIEAVFYKTTISKAYVVFKDRWNSVLASGRADADGTISVPAVKSYNGYKFIGWFDEDGNQYTVTDGKIKVSGSCNVFAKYEIDSDKKYTVKVNNEIYGEFEYNHLVRVVAEDREGQYFNGWYVGDMLVCYDNEYYFYLSGDIELTAQYGDTAVESKPLVSLIVNERNTVSEDEQSLLLTAAWYIDYKYKVTAAGIIYTFEDGKDLTIDTADGISVIRTESIPRNNNTYLDNNTSYRYTLKLNGNNITKTVYAVAYVTYVDENGESVTIYTIVQVSAA